MDLSKINTQNWIDFQARFPDAFAFLESRSLWNEYWELKSIPEAMKNDWQKGRLEELTKHFES